MTSLFSPQTIPTYERRLLDWKPILSKQVLISTQPRLKQCGTATPTAPITVSGESREFVEDFTYLGSLITKDNGAQKDTKARLGEARGAFVRTSSHLEVKPVQSQDQGPTV